MPLKISRHDFRLFRQNAFKARIVIGEPLYLGVGLLETLEDRAEPDRCPDELVAETEAIENFCAALANRDSAAWRLLEGDITAAVFPRQRILRFCCLCSRTGCQKCDRAEGGTKRHIAWNFHGNPRK